MNLGDLIKRYRKQAGLTQEKMAEKINVSRQAVTKWENGTGTPDISNIAAIAELFQISIDELLSNNKTESKTNEYIYESKTEYDIDERKNYDINLGGANMVELNAYDGEKIKVSLLSNLLKSISSDYKIKIDDKKKVIDIDMHKFNDAKESTAKEGLIIKIYLPIKYIGKIELAVNARILNICDIDNEIIEVGGNVNEVSLRDNKCKIAIDSNQDIKIDIISHTGSLEINQVSAASCLLLPNSYNFRLVKKGISTNVYFEKNGMKTEDFSDKSSNNFIEFNGIKSELVIIEKDMQ